MIFDIIKIVFLLIVIYVLLILLGLRIEHGTYSEKARQRWTNKTFLELFGEEFKSISYYLKQGDTFLIAGLKAILYLFIWVFKASGRLLIIVFALWSDSAGSNNYDDELTEAEEEELKRKNERDRRNSI